MQDKLKKRKQNFLLIPKSQPSCSKPYCIR